MTMDNSFLRTVFHIPPSRVVARKREFFSSLDYGNKSSPGTLEAIPGYDYRNQKSIACLVTNYLPTKYLPREQNRSLSRDEQTASEMLIIPRLPWQPQCWHFMDDFPQDLISYQRFLSSVHRGNCQETLNRQTFPPGEKRNRIFHR